MSPRVTMTISAAAIGRTPLTHLLEAVAAARRRGLHLRCGQSGVLAGAGEWRVDRVLQPNGVSLGGAVLLHLQPEPVDGEEALAAAARAMDVAVAWVEGAEAGWCREPPGQEGQPYEDGYAAATKVRQLLDGPDA